MVMGGTERGDRLLLTIDEAADRLGLGRSFVYVLLRRGELRAVKIGASRRIAVADLEEFVRRVREVGP